MHFSDISIIVDVITYDIITNESSTQQHRHCNLDSYKCHQLQTTQMLLVPFTKISGLFKVQKGIAVEKCVICCQ
jgi:hypothetical protein